MNGPYDPITASLFLNLCVLCRELPLHDCETVTTGASWSGPVAAPATTTDAACSTAVGGAAISASATADATSTADSATAADSACAADSAATAAVRKSVEWETQHCVE
ncbi:hypothetical protein PQR71_40230 [Paraburkholderia fungorum]|uniref:hypothetical protein n=1 Tax=Paraburkholderia fungorum TaxID=134537 RepID=UPI0038B72FC9